jgi:hypothetical protein
LATTIPQIRDIDNNNREPSYEEAMAGNERSKWKRSIEKELNSLNELNTFEIIDHIPPGRKPLGYKYVMKKKRSGEYKVRLTVKGYNQIYGVDFDETFSPVAKLQAVRTVLSIGAGNGWNFKTFDVASAFPNATLEEEIYMEVPIEMTEAAGKHLRLRKALYGLKQSSRAWYKMLTNLLKTNGFKASTLEPCVLMKGSDKNDKIVIVIYVDDILAGSNNIEAINSLANLLEVNFKITESELNDYLGLNIQYDKNNKTLSFDNNTYTKHLLEKYRHFIKDKENKDVPMTVGITLEQRKPEEASAIEDQNKPYRQIGGALLYLANSSRPDILYAVNKCLQFMSNPNETHWECLLDILRYLNKQPRFSLTFSQKCKGTINNVEGFVDADHGMCTTTRRSTTGYLIYLNGGLIAWSVKLQKSASGGGPSESEYKALYSITTEIIYTRQFLKELGYEQINPTKINEDNKGVIDFVKGYGVSQSRMKHVDIKYHVIKEYIETNQIEITWVDSGKQLADIMTKALDNKKHTSLRRELIESFLTTPSIVVEEYQNIFA